jgi:hypothetical protein
MPDSTDKTRDKRNKFATAIASAIFGASLTLTVTSMFTSNHADREITNINDMSKIEVNLVRIQIQNIESNTGRVSNSACNYLRSAPSELAKDGKVLSANTEDNVLAGDLLEKAAQTLRVLKREAPECVAVHN